MNLTQPNCPLRVQLCLLLAISCIAGCYKRHEVTRTFEADPKSPTSSDKDEPARLRVKLQEPDAQVVLAPELGQLDISPAAPTSVHTDPGLKVAVFGDQGVKATARSVLQLIAREHADMVIHLGDLSYEDASPAGWEAQIDAILGSDFPYFAVIGNHDVPSWFIPDGFAQRLSARLLRMHGAHCQGEYAINSSCTFRGLHFVLSGVGTYGRDHEQFLQSALESSTAMHNLCAWHKNQRDMQVGGKVDEVGWRAYQICARFGVPVVTGHEHSYARTYALSSVGNRSLRHGAGGSASDLILGPGRTFVVVSGLGGASARVWTKEHLEDSWWASIYAGTFQVINGTTIGTNPNIDFGVLFITYGADGDPANASAYFKTINDKVADHFSWRNDTAPSALSK
jgi:hypothetical protein